MCCTLNHHSQTSGCNLCRTEEDSKAGILLKQRPYHSSHVDALSYDSAGSFLKDQNPDYIGKVNSLAALYVSVGSYDEAEPLYLEAKSLSEEVLGKQHPHYATSLSNLANLYQSMGHYEKAEPLYLEAKSLMVIQTDISRADAPHGSLSNSFKIRPGYPMSVNNLATLYASMGCYDKAEPLFVEAKSLIAQVLGQQHPDYTSSVNNLANLYKSMGSYAKAEPLFIEAKTLTENVLGTKHPMYINSVTNLANLYESEGSYEKAEPLYLEAQAVIAKVLGKQHPGYAISLNNLAKLYETMGSMGWSKYFYDKAEPLYFEAKMLRATVLGKQHPDYACSVSNLATLYESMGAYNKAEPLFLEAKELTEKLLGKQHPHYANCLRNLANLCQSRGRYEQAEPLYVEAGTLIARVSGKLHPHYAKLLLNLAMLYNATDRKHLAVDVCAEAFQVNFCLLIASMPGPPLPRKLDFMVDTGRALSLLVELSTSLSYSCDMDIPRLQLISDSVVRWKNVLLDVQLSDTACLTSGGDEECRSSLAFVKHRLSQVVLFGMAQGQRTSESIDTLYNEMELLESAHRRPLLKNKLTCGSARIQTSHIARALPKRSAVAEYILGAHNYFVLIISTDSQKPAKLLRINASSRDINTAIVNFRQLSASRLENHRLEAKTYGHWLRENLLDIIVECIGPSTEHLFIAPDGDLSTLAFATLPTDNDGYVLDWKLNISFLNAARELLHLGSHDNSREDSDKVSQTSTSRSSLIIANPAFDSTCQTSDCRVDAERPGVVSGMAQCVRTTGIFYSLQGTNEEARKVSGILNSSGLSAVTLTGEAASVAALRSAQGPPILHVATHGFFLPSHSEEEARSSRAQRKIQNPMRLAGLAFAGAKTWDQGRLFEPSADPGIVTALELCHVNLRNTELVIFSACDTGLGQSAKGQSVAGLGRAVALAGAKSLMLSLWKGHDKATVAIMESFYANLLQADRPMSCADALREAQRNLRYQGFEAYYWGAFVLYGSLGSGPTRTKLPKTKPRDPEMHCFCCLPKMLSSVPVGGR